MVTSLGAVTMAAHEILRQVWIISIQAFMALDICAQSMVASYLGQVTALSAALSYLAFCSSSQYNVAALVTLHCMWSAIPCVQQ